ncbi:transposase [Paenibacillus sedimenti]|uniref:IS1595 family transposase n=1 Tax=Paenibacillus sedimenti TaxID=2770274 RepID=A0A926QI63_9BACL|nr:transposase [Paenibacillus sedimenti]MBD0379017.1 IS1595 family transposase [Paenibacillus sedimenti]
MDFTNMSLEQFQCQYSTEDACAKYVFHIKWPNGFICPRCEHRHAYLTKTRRLPLYECSHCRHQSSITAGTVMEGSRTELRKWLLSIFLVSREEQGINAVELSRIIQVTYKTAWLILFKIRQVIQKADQNIRLTGSVRVNSAVYGRPFNPSVHKHPKEHLLLIGSSLNEHGVDQYLKIKLVIPENPRDRHISRSVSLAFTNQHIAPHTNNIESVTRFYSPKRTRPLMIFAHQASKWINETFHGLGARHLQMYLDEFSFRMNMTIKNTQIFPRLALLCFSSPISCCTYFTRLAS